MSEWQDPWDSPQLFSTPEVQDSWYTSNEHMEEIRQQRAARMASRYYCPTCGEVSYGYRSPIRGWVVDDHVKCVAAEGKNDYFYRRCPGGKIDETKDKAP